MQRAKCLILLSGITLQGVAAGLNPETAKAWDEYTASVRAQMQARLGPTACFLWAEEEQGGMSRLRAGEILASPANGHMPRRAPGGLIHHWIGAVFLPGVTLPQVLTILRDYGRYPEYYPSVVNSRLVARHGLTDTFITLERHQAMFSKIGLDADLVATYIEAGSGKAYSTSSTTRLRQVQNFGSRGQRELEPYAPQAYLWSLSSVSRYLERDGGVYLELEAMALSRDIPAGLRWAVEPFVRQAAEDTLIATLRQMRQAVLGEGNVRAVKLPSGAMAFGAR